MAHPRLDGRDLGTADGERPERVAQVVEAQLPQAGSLERAAL